MHTEYRVVLSVAHTLSDDGIVLSEDNWTRLSYGLGHVGKIVKTLVDGSHRKSQSWESFVWYATQHPDSGHGWGTWLDVDGKRSYVSVESYPVTVGSEWEGLGER